MEGHQQPFNIVFVMLQYQLYQDKSAIAGATM